MSPLRFLRTAPRSALAILTLITVLAAVSGAFVVLAPEAAAQEDPAIARARERLQQAQSEANAAHDRYEKAIDERDQAQAQIAELEAAIPVLRAQEAELRTQETLLRAQLGIRAAALYKHTDPAEGLEVLAAKDRMRAGRKTKLTEAADQFDDERARQLLETADRVQKMQAELDAKRAELEDKRAELDRLVTRLDQEKAVFEQKVAAANRALEVAEEIGALRALGEPVMGPPVLSAAELVAWYRSTGSSPRLSGVTIDELAQMFIEEGLAENVRGDFAFAQAYHETGGFRTAAARTTSRVSARATDARASVASPPPSTVCEPRSSTSGTTPTVAREPPIWRIRPRRTGTGPIRLRRRGTSTRSSPRAGRRRGS